MHLYVRIYVTNRRTYDMWLVCGDVSCVDMCMCTRGGGVPQWIFQFHVVFSFAHRRFHPSASSFASRFGRNPASLTLEVCAACLCTAVIYSLLERYGFPLAAPCRGGGSESRRAGDARDGRRGRNLSISNPPSVVNSSIYRRGIRCIVNRLGSLLVTWLAAGAGNPRQTSF